MRSIRNILGILIFATIFAITSSHAQQGVNAVLQSAAVANGNGTEFLVAGNSGSILTVNCNACAGGTTVNFEASEDGTNYTSIVAFLVGTTTTSTSTTTAGVTVWQISVSGMVKVRARISAYSAGTITITGHAYPVANGSLAAIAGTGATSQQVQGAGASGATAAGNPVRIAGKTPAGNTIDIAASVNGAFSMANSVTGADGITNVVADHVYDNASGAAPLRVNNLAFNGAAPDRVRTSSSTNLTASSTLTSRNSIGAQLVEKGSRWVVNSAPAAGVVASASIAVETGIKHVLDTVCWSGGSTVAPAATSLQLNIRDGATGAGTILMSLEFDVTATTGQNIPAGCISGLGLVGTAGTAMTVEFNSLLANLKQTATAIGYNVN